MEYIMIITVLIISFFFFFYLLCRINIPFLRTFFCKIRWHSHKYDNTHKADNDPLEVLTFAECQWCGFKGQVDSQGNLF